MAKDKNYYAENGYYYVGLMFPNKCCMRVHPSLIDGYKDFFHTLSYEEYLKWYFLR